jgi:hypothetical protein
VTVWAAPRKVIFIVFSRDGLWAALPGGRESVYKTGAEPTPREKV